MISVITLIDWLHVFVKNEKQNKLYMMEGFNVSFKNKKKGPFGHLRNQPASCAFLFSPPFFIDIWFDFQAQPMPRLQQADLDLRCWYMVVKTFGLLLVQLAYSLSPGP